MLIILLVFGIFVGVLSAFLGIGGGIVIVPALVAWGITAQAAVAISAFSIVLTSSAATWKNWQTGKMQVSHILTLCIPSLLLAPVGSLIASTVSEAALLLLFAAFLVVIFFTMNARARLASQERPSTTQAQSSPPPQSSTLGLVDPRIFAAKVFTGSITGFCSGFFGIGGGIILVPLQVLLLKVSLKQAIRYSLGVILPTALVASISHMLLGNLQLEMGLAIGIGGIIGAYAGATFLNKGSEGIVKIGFQSIIIVSLLITLVKAASLLKS
jgi:uncharacterized membrane protein YfcA